MTLLIVGIAGLIWLSFLIMIAARIVQPHNSIWKRIPSIFLVIGVFFSGTLILITILAAIFTDSTRYLIGLGLVFLIAILLLFLLLLLLQFLKMDYTVRFTNRSTFALLSAVFALIFFLLAGTIAGFLEGTDITIKNILALIFFTPVLSIIVGVGVFVGLGSSAKMQEKLQDQVKKL